MSSLLTAKGLEPHDQKILNDLANRWTFHDALQHALAMRTGKDTKSINGPSQFFSNQTAEQIRELKLDHCAPRATHLPWSLLSTRAGAGAGNAINTVTNRRDAFTTILSDSSLLPELGAKELFDLIGKVHIPRQTSVQDAVWADNSTDNAATDDSLEESELESKTVYITRKAPRSLTRGGNSQVSDLLLEEMAASAGNLMLSAVINGDGSTGVPRGILQQAADSGTDFLTVSLPTSGNPTYSSLLEIERKHANSRALSESSAWIVSPTMLETLRGIADGNGHPVLTSALDGNRLLGYRIRSTPSCPANKLIFGDFSKIALLYWAPGVDLVVDPFTLVSQVVFSVFMYVNHLVLQPGAFVVAS